MEKKIWFFLVLLSFNAFANSGLLGITPFHRKTQNPLCQPILIDSTNVVGIYSISVDPQVTRTRVLFQDGQKQNHAELNLLREDAENLRVEIGALMSKSRLRPLRLNRTLSPEGHCTIWELED